MPEPDPLLPVADSGLCSIAHRSGVLAEQAATGRYKELHRGPLAQFRSPAQWQRRLERGQPQRRQAGGRDRFGDHFD
jgi:hypothetical protein